MSHKIHATLFIARIDWSVLKQIVLMGCFDKFDPKAKVQSLTNDNIKQYVLDWFS